MPVLTAENWDKTKKGSKQGFDTVWAWADKLGAPVNKLTNKIGSEAFWPTTLDKEADKAARILQSFCKDGFYSQEEGGMTEEARNIAKYSKQRVIKKIPPSVIKNAKGLAIFTVMRSGLWVSGAGGSGILIARQDDGMWSPPSGILIHTAALGFVFGADIYDSVIVINSQQALDAFKALRATLGGELSAVAGPVGVGGVVEGNVTKLSAPLFTYMKSRGLYAGLGANGSIIIERKDENEKFYREKISAGDILKGKAKHVPRPELKMLWTTLRAAQGDLDYNEEDLPDDRPTPGDLQLERMNDSESFGLPTVDDPDPFGVHALEQEGFEIREAGTGTKPSEEVFEYKPAESSPAYAALKRRSLAPPAPIVSGSGGSSRQSSHSHSPKQKMSNPWIVPYTDSSTQTIGDEAREQEMAEEALKLPKIPVSISARGPPPSLPPRSFGSPTPPPRSVQSSDAEMIGPEKPTTSVFYEVSEQDGAEAIAAPSRNHRSADEEVQEKFSDDDEPPRERSSPDPAPSEGSTNPWNDTILPPSLPGSLAATAVEPVTVVHTHDMPVTETQNVTAPTIGAPIIEFSELEDHDIQTPDAKSPIIEGSVTESPARPISVTSNHTWSGATTPSAIPFKFQGIPFEGFQKNDAAKKQSKVMTEDESTEAKAGAIPGAFQ